MSDRILVLLLACVNSIEYWDNPVRPGKSQLRHTIERTIVVWHGDGGEVIVALAGYDDDDHHHHHHQLAVQHLFPFKKCSIVEFLEARASFQISLTATTHSFTLPLYLSLFLHLSFTLSFAN